MLLNILSLKSAPKLWENLQEAQRTKALVKPERATKKQNNNVKVNLLVLATPNNIESHPKDKFLLLTPESDNIARNGITAPKDKISIKAAKTIRNTIDLNSRFLLGLTKNHNCLRELSILVI